MWWGWEKNPKTKKKRLKTKEKIPHLVALPTLFYDMEANYFPVSENTENNLDLP